MSLRAAPSPALRPGLIFEVAQQAGLHPRGEGTKRQLRCPFHDDQHSSAFLSSNNVFYCSVCTPDGGWSAKRFTEALGVHWPPPDAFEQPGRIHPQADSLKSDQSFSPILAREVWQAALARARDDDHLDADRAVYEFVSRRGIGHSWEDGLFGVLSEGMDLPGPISRWPSTGHCLIAPLYDLTGSVACIQSRSVRNGDPKILAPTGGRVKGTLFADERGLAVLRGSAPTTQAVIYGEGLTDSLALAIASPIAVLCAPGTNNAVAGIDTWTRSRQVVIALDNDSAGQAQVDPVAAALSANRADRVFRLTWPKGCKDACDVVAQLGTIGLHALLSKRLAEARA
jgi:hypothetical protein